MVGTSQDITERKSVEELRDNILSTVSHELRTPLAAIIGFAETLKERGTAIAAATYDEIVTSLTVQARKLERLLADLLDLERLRHGLVQPSFREADVGELVARVAAAQAADGRVVDVIAERAVAEVDAPKVERIVENLLVNAVKHTPPDARIALRVQNRGENVLVSVDDRGPGVPEGDRDAIFEIFTRGDAVSHTPGAGIGLSLVAQFTALHGGRVWVEDNPGGGASFRVLLPARRPH
jgi:two-component system sensor histidine kinase KdpD